MTDFPNLKAKFPSLIPTRMDFECGPGWEVVLDKYFGEVANALTDRSAPSPGKGPPEAWKPKS